MKNKLLVAGGAYGDIPLIKAAKELGFYVITTGNRPNELGHSCSDEYICANYSDRESLLKLAVDNNIQVICPSCSDISAISSAYVAEALQLPGHDSYETACIIHNKDNFKQFCQDNDVPSPAAACHDNIQSALNTIDFLTYPAIVKPVDMTGGQGVRKAYNAHEMRQAILDAFSASQAKRVVIEEFIDGTYHGFSAFIRTGKVVFWYHDDEYYYFNKYRVAATSTPSSVPWNVLDRLKNEVERIARLLQLVDGLFHIQFILKNGSPYIMDVCRRLPGDLYPLIVEYATGLDYASYMVKFYAGIDCSDLSQSESSGFFGRTNILCKSRGVIADLAIDTSIIDKIIGRYMWVHPGDHVANVDVPKFGIAFLQFDSVSEMKTTMNDMPDLIYFTAV